MIVGRRAAVRTAMPAPSASTSNKVAGGTPAPPPGKADVLHARDVYPALVAPAVAGLSGDEAGPAHTPGTVTATVVGAFFADLPRYSAHNKCKCMCRISAFRFKKHLWLCM